MEEVVECEGAEVGGCLWVGTVVRWGLYTVVMRLDLLWKRRGGQVYQCRIGSLGLAHRETRRDMVFVLSRSCWVLKRCLELLQERLALG